MTQEATHYVFPRCASRIELIKNRLKSFLIPNTAEPMKWPSAWNV